MVYKKGVKYLLLILIELFSFSFAGAAVLHIEEKNRLLADADGAYEICWFGIVDSETTPLRHKIEAHLTAQITERAGLKLKFIPDCLISTDATFPVAIAFYDALDNTEGIQNSLPMAAYSSNPAGHPTTYSNGVWNNKNFVDIVLTSHFKNVSPSLEEQSKNLSPQTAENLLASIALHEFLHALGFDHEQDRADSQCSQGQDFAPTIDIPLTAYDPVSIMNYCYTHAFNFENGPMKLSDLDILGIKKIYPNQ